MATKITTPIPQDKIEESFVWRDWFQRLSDRVFGTISTQDSSNVTITGGTIAVTSVTTDTLYVPTGTDGQVLIGKTSDHSFAPATLTAGTNITITNAANSITIAASGAGAGDVVGPASATDNAIARFDTTTGKLIQNSVVTVNDTGDVAGLLSEQFSDGTATTLAAGKMWYNGTTGSWNMGMGNGNITQQVGEETFMYGKASAAITDSPLQIVYHTGTVGASGVITFAPTIAGITNVNDIIGVATENIAHNDFGRITAFGVVRGITTNGTAFGQTWADDDVIWYDPVTGNPTKVEPVAPNIKVQIGTVINAGSGGSGSFQVLLRPGSVLGGTDSNVQFSSLANNNLIAYDSTLGYWKNVTPGSVTGIGSVANAVTFNNGGAGAASGTTFDGSVARTISYNTIGAQPSGTYVTSVTGTAPVVSSGGTTPAISMAAATASVSGYLTSTDWNTFNNKGSGTVTSVSGTIGNITSTGGATPVIDLASGIATAGTTGSASLVPVVTIDTYGRVTSITTAANPQGTVTSVTGTSPIASSGGATPALSLSASYGDTQNPYASKTANYVLAAPNGAAGVPTFRAIVAADIPTLNQNTTGSAGSVANALTSGTGISFSSGTTYNGSVAITINNSLPMVYPGSGIPNSTGTAWGTSYSTTGSGTVVALATSPSFTTPILGTPASGTVTNLTGTASININGTVGATTPASGAFTTLSSTGNTTIGDAVADTITVNGQFVTGTVLRSAQTATNTLALAAYDTDGAAYTNLVTLTASTTPTLALTSTGVGTINNMSIGATTASTGTFTGVLVSGLTASKPVFTDATKNLTSAGTVPANQGGTGQSSYAVGDLLYASTTTALSKLADVATGNALISGGVGVAPAWGKIALTTHVSGTLPVANGGTGLTAGTSGGVLYYSATGTLASSALLTQYGVVYGGGAGATPVSTAAGTTGQVLTATTGGAPSWAAPATSGTVTSVSFTGGIITVATATTTPAFTVAGTSGGIPYFSSASTWATSAALAANALVVGGGAGVAPATVTTGTGVVTALGVAVGTAGSFVVNGGALGTPSSGTVTNLTGTASININGTVGATTPTTGSFTDVSVTTALGDSAFNENNTITGWLYSGNSFSVATQETAPNGLFIGSNGTKMYVNGQTGDDVNEFTLSTAWDITTATFVTTFSTAAQDTVPQDIFFKPDGLSMFVIGSTNDRVFQYTLSTAWSVSTASYASISFSVTTQETSPLGLWFKPDGLVMYVIGSSSDTVFQYTLSVAWDVSTASYASIFYSVTAQDTGPTQVNLSADGLKMWVLGSTGDDIWEYSLGTAWNVSTATPVNNFYVGFQETSPAGMFIDSTATNRVYVVGGASDTVYQYYTAANSLKLDTEKLYVDGALSANGNFVAGQNAYVDGFLNIQGAITAGSITVGATSVSTLSSSSTTSLATSTAAQTVALGAGATVSGSLKTINIGTAGVSGSTTAINFGSAVSGATTTVGAYGTWTFNTAIGIASGGTGQITAGAAFNALSPVTSTGDLIIGNGTNSATRLGIGSNGYVLTSNGTTATWAAGGGGSLTISNDTSTASDLYPAFFSATSGTASTVYTSNANLLYKPSTGELTALAHVSSNGIQVNSSTVSANYTIATGNNGLSAGPISIAGGISVTVSTGSVWTVV